MAAFSVPERVPLPFNVRLSQELVDDLDALAVRHQTTRSRIIRGLLQQALERVKEDATQEADG
jgi:predicted transcriptional regulator